MSQVALVTGSAVRIGKAVALRLADAGLAIAVHYNSSRDDAEKLVKTIRASGGKAASFKAALSDIRELKALIPAVAEELGALSCLINNASRFEDDRLATLTLEQWEEQMTVNLRAPVFLSQAFAAQLPQGMEGNIVNIVDQRVLRPNPLFFSYTLSKLALWSATRTMAQALAPRIRVNAIAPGPALRSVHQTDEDFRRECEAMPLGHGTTPDEIADAVLFILRARSMTGQTIALDGGQHLVWRTRDIRPAE